MTREDFIKLRIDDVVYNKETNCVATLTSQWSDSKGMVSDDEYLSTKGFDAIRMGDYDKWEHVSEGMPDSIKLKILTERFFELEAFVYSRLH